MIGVFVQVGVKPWIGYIVQENGCWSWTGYLDREGYGGAFLHGKAVRAHRMVYESTVGPIPQGMTLDHLCRNPSCVRPDHLEPATNRVNILRGTCPSALNAQKTHCRAGHPLVELNRSRRERGCPICKRQRDTERRASKRLVALERGEG